MFIFSFLKSTSGKTSAIAEEVSASTEEQTATSLTETESGIQQIEDTGDLFDRINELFSQMVNGLEKTTHHGNEVARLKDLAMSVDRFIV